MYEVIVEEKHRPQWVNTYSEDNKHRHIHQPKHETHLKGTHREQIMEETECLEDIYRYKFS